MPKYVRQGPRAKKVIRPGAGKVSLPATGILDVLERLMPTHMHTSSAPLESTEGGGTRQWCRRRAIEKG